MNKIKVFSLQEVQIIKNFSHFFLWWCHWCTLVRTCKCNHSIRVSLINYNTTVRNDGRWHLYKVLSNTYKNINVWKASFRSAKRRLSDVRGLQCLFKSSPLLCYASRGNIVHNFEWVHMKTPLDNLSWQDMY